MSRNGVVIIVAFLIMLTIGGVAHECNGGRPNGDEWRRMKNAVERLDKNVDRLNKKCGIDPTKASR